MVDEGEIRSRYEAAGQGHVLHHLDLLSNSSSGDGNNNVDEQKNAFLEQLNGIPVETISSLLDSALADQKKQQEEQEDGGTKIQPFPMDQVASTKTTDSETLKSYHEIGLKAIQDGQVAALVLAGGQGTRLGFAGPKGMYDIGLPSGRTLFQLLCERINKLRQLGGETASLPFYIMTSPINHDETMHFFKMNNYFGLSSNDVKFFPQGMLPCLTMKTSDDDTGGKIMMEGLGKVAMAPDGNGGIYPSLKNSGMLQDMNKRGIRYLHAFSIDNALTKPADPLFVGYCIAKEADCGNKVVWKAHAHEKVGVLAMVVNNNEPQPCVVEYSDITKEMAEQTTVVAGTDTSRLAFGAANICNHFYTIDFIQNVIVPNMGTMYHIAKKKIPYYDESKEETITPTTSNGMKLETFIFDVFPLSKRMAILDVKREEEFAPVKNAPGPDSVDSPDTARALLSNLAKQWVHRAGGSVEEPPKDNRNNGGDEEDDEKDKEGAREFCCEIGPLTSYGGEGLEELVKHMTLRSPFSM